MSQLLPWYDSLWLGKYLIAKEIIARIAPDKAEWFVHSFDSLRTSPDFSLKQQIGLIAPNELGDLRQAIAEIPKERFEFHELARFGRLVIHNCPEFLALHRRFADLVSELTGEAVEPAYSFFAMYTRKGVCEPHLDAPVSKWTLDICINQSEPWPINFSQVVPWPEEPAELDPDWKTQIKSLASLRYQSVTLSPGDAVLFSGSSQWHFRDRMAGTTPKGQSDLLMLHYIPQGTAEVVEHKNWARLFDVPELANIPGIAEDQLAFTTTPVLT